MIVANASSVIHIYIVIIIVDIVVCKYSVTIGADPSAIGSNQIVIGQTG